MTKRKFEVGDLAVVRSNSYGCNLGIGTVIDYKDNWSYKRLLYRVKFKNSLYSYYFYSYQLNKINTKTEELWV